MESVRIVHGIELIQSLVQIGLDDLASCIAVRTIPIVPTVDSGLYPSPPR